MDSLAVFQDLMNEQVIDDLVVAAAARLPWYHLLEREASGLELAEGQYFKWPIELSAVGNAQPRLEKQDMPIPGGSTWGQGRARLAQYANSIGWTQEMFENATRAGGSACVNVVERMTKRAPEDMRWKLNRAMALDGTGRLARVSSYSAGSGTGVVTVDNTRADFGWDKLAWLRNGDVIDIYTIGNTGSGFPLTSNSSGPAVFTVKATKVVVSQVNQTAGTFRITENADDTGSDITTSPANSDYVFVANSFKLTAGAAFMKWNNMAGILNHIDDCSSAGAEFTETVGANGDWSGGLFNRAYTEDEDGNVTSIARSSIPELNGLIKRAGDWASGGTDGTVATCTLRDIEDMLLEMDLRGDEGQQVEAIALNRKTRQWMSELAMIQQNGFTQIQGGKVVPGLVISQWRTGGGQMIDVIPVDQMPDGHIDFINYTDLRLPEPIKLGWKTVNGNRIVEQNRDLTYESWMRVVLNLIALRCDKLGQMQDIDIAA